MWSVSVSSCFQPVPTVDRCGRPVVAQCCGLRLPAGDLQTAAARHYPAGGGRTAVSLHNRVVTT